jgi:hypothetical protein
MANLTTNQQSIIDQLANEFSKINESQFKAYSLINASLLMSEANRIENGKAELKAHKYAMMSLLAIQIKDIFDLLCNDLCEIEHLSVTVNYPNITSDSSDPDKGKIEISSIYESFGAKINEMSVEIKPNFNYKETEFGYKVDSIMWSEPNWKTNNQIYYNSFKEIIESESIQKKLLRLVEASKKIHDSHKAKGGKL